MIFRDLVVAENVNTVLAELDRQEFQIVQVESQVGEAYMHLVAQHEDNPGDLVGIPWLFGDVSEPQPLEAT